MVKRPQQRLFPDGKENSVRWITRRADDAILNSGCWLHSEFRRPHRSDVAHTLRRFDIAPALRRFAEKQVVDPRPLLSWMPDQAVWTKAHRFEGTARRRARHPARACTLETIERWRAGRQFAVRQTGERRLAITKETRTVRCDCEVETGDDRSSLFQWGYHLVLTAVREPTAGGRINEGMIGANFDAVFILRYDTEVIRRTCMEVAHALRHRLRSRAAADAFVGYRHACSVCRGRAVFEVVGGVRAVWIDHCAQFHG